MNKNEHKINLCNNTDFELFDCVCSNSHTGRLPAPGINCHPHRSLVAQSTTPTSVPTEVVPTPTHIPVDLTPAQMAAVQAVSKKYNIPVDQIHIANTEAVTWPTGCLGVVIPGVMCTDVVTPGFRIMLTANGQQFEMHTNQDGSSVIDAAQQLATLGFVVQTDRSFHPGGQPEYPPRANL